MVCKTQHILGVLGLMVLLGSSCKRTDCPGGKTELINSFNAFINTTIRAKQFYSIREWESKDKEFTGFLQDCYPKFDTMLYLDERQRFWSDAVRYYFKRYDNRVTVELLNNKNPNSKMMQNQIKSIWADPDEAFTQIFKEMTGLKFDDAIEAVRDTNLTRDQ